MFNRSKFWAIALLVAMFTLGAAVAWGVEEWGDDRRRRIRHDTDAMVQLLDRKLALSPAQRDSVRAVFVSHRAVTDSIWRDVRPRVDSVRAAMRVQINALLDSAQQERYARLIARDKHRRKDGGSKDQSGGRN